LRLGLSKFFLRKDHQPRWVTRLTIQKWAHPAREAFAARIQPSLTRTILFFKRKSSWPLSFFSNENGSERDHAL
jgi:hypothetical protein